MRAAGIGSSGGASKTGAEGVRTWGVTNDSTAVKRAACYTRVSTDEQAREGLSLPGQEERLRAFCASQGWQVAGLYVDDGYSGTTLERPGMRRLLADIAAGQVDLVVVYKLDRLSRRQMHVLHLLEDVFEPAQVGFRSATEPIDTTTPFR